MRRPVSDGMLYAPKLSTRFEAQEIKESDSAGEKPCPKKEQKNPLDSDRPSHGRPFRSLRGFECYGDFAIAIALHLKKG
jgi:hypothetical protein